MCPHSYRGKALENQQIVASLSDELEKKGPLDSATVSVEPSPNSKESADKLGTEHRQRIKAMVGNSAAIEVEGRGKLPRSTGKARRIIDRRE